MVNLILHYMSIIPTAAVSQFNDIFKELITYQNFYNYLLDAPF